MAVYVGHLAAKGAPTQCLCSNNHISSLPSEQEPSHSCFLQHVYIRPSTPRDPDSHKTLKNESIASDPVCKLVAYHEYSRTTEKSGIWATYRSDLLSLSHLTIQMAFPRCSSCGVTTWVLYYNR